MLSGQTLGIFKVEQKAQFIGENRHLQKALVLFLPLVGLLCGSSS